MHYPFEIRIIRKLLSNINLSVLVIDNLDAVHRMTGQNIILELAPDDGLNTTFVEPRKKNNIAAG